MKISEVNIYNTAKPNHYQVSFLAIYHDEHYRYREIPFSFRLEEKRVFFVTYDIKEGNRLIGEADTQEEQIEKAKQYLEWYLKKIEVIGTLESSLHLKIIREDSRGAGYFGLQVWAWSEETKGRKDTLFHFRHENERVYYLGNDKESKEELIKFVYMARNKMSDELTEKKELLPSPKDKEEAIQDAIDFLEWQLTARKIKGYRA